MTDEALDILRDAKEGGVTSTLALSKYNGMPRTTLRRLIDKYDMQDELDAIYAGNYTAGSVRTANGDKITRTGTAAGETIESKGSRITSLEELLEAADVDLKTWRVKSYTASSWESGDETKYAVRAQLERVPGTEDLDALKAATVAAMIEYAPDSRSYMIQPDKSLHRTGLAMEVSIPDLHLGKLAHAEVRIGDALVMVRDEIPELGFQSPAMVGGTPIQILVYVEDAGAIATRASAAGAKIVRPVEEQFHGDVMATLEDPFGYLWFFATHVEDIDADDLAARSVAYEPTHSGSSAQ